MATIFGYVRVSSRDQNEDRQLIALKEMIESNDPLLHSQALITDNCIRVIKKK